MQETCWFCQKATDYDRWIAESAQTDFGVSYPVPFTKTWMPFFISRRKTTPKFDENFYYYGYDRLMQVKTIYLKSANKFIFSDLRNENFKFLIPSSFARISRLARLQGESLAFSRRKASKG